MIEAKGIVIKAMVSKRTWDSISQYKATICSNGWSNTNSQPQMNVMLIVPIGDVFLRSVDKTRINKT